jgi:hypothetical protein
MQNANASNNLAVTATDVILLAMLKHKVMQQDPADANNFIFIKLPKKVYAKRFAAAEAEAHAIMQNTNTDSTVFN